MSNRDVVHQWSPSVRLRRLIAARGGIPIPTRAATNSTTSGPMTSVSPVPTRAATNAVLWVREHAMLFPSRRSSARLLTILQYRFDADLTIDSLRDLVARSWVQDNRVQGALKGTRNLGLKLFAELQDVLTHAS